MMSRFLIFVSFLFLATLCSCSVFQDVDYALRLATDGQEKQAEKMLTELSNDGYIEAQLALADLYSKSGDPRKLILAGAYYRQLRWVSPRTDYKYVRWLAQMSRIRSDYCEPAHRALLERQEKYHDALPLLARFYSFHRAFYSEEKFNVLLKTMLRDTQTYGREIARILNGLDHPESFSDQIHQLCASPVESVLAPTCIQLNFKLAKAANDTDTIKQLSKQLEKKYPVTTDRLAPETEELLVRCSSILLNKKYGPPHILAGLRIAARGARQSPRLFLIMAKKEYRQRILLNDEELLAGLERLAGQGDVEATRILGRMYANGDRIIDDPVKAEQLLQKVRNDPKASLYLGRLYLSGKRGSAKLQAGVDCLLFSARHGEYKAYYELAQAFNGWPGIRRNNLYSWVFATMALETIPDPRTQESLHEFLQTLAEDIVDQTRAEKQLSYEQAKLRETMPLLGREKWSTPEKSNAL